MKITTSENTRWIWKLIYVVILKNSFKACVKMCSLKMFFRSTRILFLSLQYEIFTSKFQTQKYKSKKLQGKLNMMWSVDNFDIDIKPGFKKYSANYCYCKYEVKTNCNLVCGTSRYPNNTPTLRNIGVWNE